MRTVRHSKRNSQCLPYTTQRNSRCLPFTTQRNSLRICLHIRLQYSSTACPSLSVTLIVVVLTYCNTKGLLIFSVLFVTCQVSILNKEENKRDTIVDRVFRKALQEFHMQLISSYSVLMKVRPLSESVKVAILFSCENWAVHHSSHLSASWRFW